jgi:hypothetical protein
VPEGALAPELVRVQVSSGSSGVDLSAIDVSAAALRLYPRSGNSTKPIVWALTLESATPTLLVASHQFQSGDTEGKRGIYNAYVYMTPGAGGQLRAKCGLFEITAL